MAGCLPCSQAESVDTSPSLRESGEWEEGSIVTMESSQEQGQLRSRKPQHNAPSSLSLVLPQHVFP